MSELAVSVPVPITVMITVPVAGAVAAPARAGSSADGKNRDEDGEAHHSADYSNRIESDANDSKWYPRRSLRPHGQDGKDEGRDDAEKELAAEYHCAGGKYESKDRQAPASYLLWRRHGSGGRCRWLSLHHNGSGG